MYKIKVLIYLVLVIAPICMQGQTPLELAYQSINQGDVLPEDLLASRTAVFLNVPPRVEKEHSNHWQQLAAQMHQTFVDIKVDAVAYYLWQDLNAGVDATRSYFETLLNRDISQVAVVTLKEGTFQFTIIPTNDQPSFLDTEAPTWHTSGTEFSGILENLSSAVRRSGPEISNFLVVENPEIFTDTHIFTNNRFESFQPDLKLDKLAVPIVGNDDPEDPIQTINHQLQSTMGPYPFQYELVDYQKGEDLLKRAGFQYVLLSLYAPETSIKKLLDYEVSSEKVQMVYKFYIRHIVSGDIYLGDVWDGSASREDALRNHITNLKRFLKVE